MYFVANGTALQRSTRGVVGQSTDAPLPAGTSAGAESRRASAGLAAMSAHMAVAKSAAYRARRASPRVRRGRAARPGGRWMRDIHDMSGDRRCPARAAEREEALVRPRPMWSVLFGGERRDSRLERQPCPG